MPAIFEKIKPELAAKASSVKVANESLAVKQNYKLFIESAGRKLSTMNSKFRKQIPFVEGLLSSNNIEEVKRGANIVHAINNQIGYMETLAQATMKKSYQSLITEGTSQSSLGILPRNAIEVVGIFYNEMVSQYLVPFQFLTQPNGSIYVKQPKFSNTAAGVNKGDIMFANNSNGTYASAENKVTISEINNIKFPRVPLRPGTLRFFDADGKQLNVYDNGTPRSATAQIIGSDVQTAGTINYATGTITGLELVSGKTAVTASAFYYYDADNANPGESDTLIREVELELKNIPVNAKPRPVKMKYSIEAMLNASGALGVDLDADLTQLASSYLQIERDESVIRTIVDNATTYTELEFNASKSQAQGVASVFVDNLYEGFEAKIDVADTLIRKQNSKRGGVSFVIVSDYGKVIVTRLKSFEADPNINAPHVGPFRLGSLRNGTVEVIYVPDDSDNPIIAKDEYVVGFKGFVWGDGSVICADYVSLYTTNLFESPDLYNARGFLTMYDIVVNNPTYLTKGKITNFTA